MSNDADITLASIAGYTPGTWELDRANSDITIAVRQLLTTTVRGRFTRFDVAIVTGDDPLASSITATIELASVDTGNARRDEHVRSRTFFDVATYPTATYRSTGVRRDGHDWIIDGDLTLHGITRSVPLAVGVTTFGERRGGGRWAAFSATAHVNRGEFGIDRWSGGGVMVGDDVAIRLEIQAIQTS